jgi:hypothetical protein
MTRLIHLYQKFVEGKSDFNRVFLCYDGCSVNILFCFYLSELARSVFFVVITNDPLGLFVHFLNEFLLDDSVMRTRSMLKLASQLVEFACQWFCGRAPTMVGKTCLLLVVHIKRR